MLAEFEVFSGSNRAAPDISLSIALFDYAASFARAARCAALEEEKGSATANEIKEWGDQHGRQSVSEILAHAWNVPNETASVDLQLQSATEAEAAKFESRVCSRCSSGGGDS
jgi:hypothetical protein